MRSVLTLLLSELEFVFKILDSRAEVFLASQECTQHVLITSCSLSLFPPVVWGSQWVDTFYLLGQL